MRFPPLLPSPTTVTRSDGVLQIEKNNNIEDFEEEEGEGEEEEAAGEEEGDWAWMATLNEITRSSTEDVS